MHKFNQSPLYSASMASPQPEHTECRVRRRRSCEKRPVNVCTDEKVLETRTTIVPDCNSLCNSPTHSVSHSTNNSWRMLSLGVASFIILAAILWVLMYFLKPSIVVDQETGNVDQSKAILASIILSLVIVIFVGILFAIVGKSNMY